MKDHCIHAEWKKAGPSILPRAQRKYIGPSSSGLWRATKQTNLGRHYLFHYIGEDLIDKTAGERKKIISSLVHAWCPWLEVGNRSKGYHGFSY
jgi:hypothetical protein